MDLPWLALLNESIAGQPVGPLLLSLATVDEDGGADVRRVVCREISADGALWFTSDSRSGKNAQIAGRPTRGHRTVAAARPVSVSIQGARSMWLPGRRIDLRFWLKLAKATHQTFFWPAPAANDQPTRSPFPADAAAMPDTFSVTEV